MAANVAATLCYVPLCCLNVVWALYVIIAEKQNRFLRFHAFQSLLFAGALAASWTVVWIISQIVWFVGMFLTLVLAVVGIGGLIFLAVKAYGNEEFELPVLGPLAKQWS